MTTAIKVGARVQLVRIPAATHGRLDWIDTLLQGAVGTVMTLETDANGVWATVDWTPADPSKTLMDCATGKMNPVQPPRELIADRLEVTE